MPWDPMTYTPVEPGICHPRAPKIEGGVQSLTLTRTQPLAGQTHLFAPFRNAVSTTLGALSRLPIASVARRLGSLLAIFNSLLLASNAIALRCLRSLRIAFTFSISPLFAFDVSALFGSLLANRPVAFPLGGSLTLAARL